MKRPTLPKNPNSSRGVTIIDLLIVTTVIAVAVSLILPLAISAQRSLVRANAVQEFSGFVQHARSDSKKLHAVAPAQMAQITILNERYYYVVTDGDGNGALDPPVVINLENRNVRMDGPFPRTFMFDQLGRVVDQNQSMVAMPVVQFSDYKGKTAIKFDGTGQPVITAGK
jgi:type II secretory pathway pseudopilin PulG